MKKNKLIRILIILSSVLLTGCAGTDHSEKVESNSGQQTENNSAQMAERESEQNTGNSSVQTEASESEQNTERMPAKGAATGIVFEGQDMEGNTVSSTIFSDAKLTMVNVWATYCNPCLREMPGLGELAQEYDPEEFQLVGIISDVLEGAEQETLELAADLIEQTGADYPHLLLNESLYYGLLSDVTAVPTTFFINENGEILDTVVGSMEKSAWEEKVNAFLEEM